MPISLVVSRKRSLDLSKVMLTSDGEATTGLAYWGRFNQANPDTLPISGAFQPAGGRSWLIRFWEMPGKWVGIAFPFGVVLWVLFFFDHNVSVCASFPVYSFN